MVIIYLMVSLFDLESLTHQTFQTRHRAEYRLKYAFPYSLPALLVGTRAIDLETRLRCEKILISYFPKESYKDDIEILYLFFGPCIKGMDGKRWLDDATINYLSYKSIRYGKKVTYWARLLNLIKDYEVSGHEVVNDPNALGYTINEIRHRAWNRDIND